MCSPRSKVNQQWSSAAGGEKTKQILKGMWLANLLLKKKKSWTWILFTIQKCFRAERFCKAISNPATSCLRQGLPHWLLKGGNKKDSRRVKLKNPESPPRGGLKERRVRSMKYQRLFEVQQRTYCSFEKEENNQINLKVAD